MAKRGQDDSRRRIPPYKKSDPFNEPLAKARITFLEAYNKQEPRLLAELKSHVSQAFPADAENVDTGLWEAVKYRFPDLSNALSTWAIGFHLTFHAQPAHWVMDAALQTLTEWAQRRTEPKRLEWTHSPFLHEEYPASSNDEQWGVSTGKPDNNLFHSKIGIEIGPWLPDEHVRDFRSRAKSAFNEALKHYIRSVGSPQRQQWAIRPELERTEYLCGLAMWQAGSPLAEIQRKLRDDGLAVGTPEDRTATLKGIQAAAKYLQIDRLKKSYRK